MTEDKTETHEPEQEPQKAPNPVEFELPEVYVYKLQLLAKNYDEAKRVVVESLTEVFEREFRQAVANAVNNDPACIEAANTRAVCINEVLDHIESELPEGFSVAEISPENANIIAVFEPSNVGRRLPVTSKK